MRHGRRPNPPDVLGSSWLHEQLVRAMAITRLGSFNIPISISK